MYMGYIHWAIHRALKYTMVLLPSDLMTSGCAAGAVTHWHYSRSMARDDTIVNPEKNSTYELVSKLAISF